MASGLIFIIIVVALVLYMGSLYNRLVSLKNRHQNAFAQIDVQLKRRHDLVPGLVDVARAYLTHERQTLESVIAARQSAAAARATAASRGADARAIQRLDSAEQALSGGLSKLFALAEAYPALKADETLERLSEELASTENRIGFARQAYNDAVTDYNTAIARFPDLWVAAGCGFRASAWLHSTRSAAERQPVAVAL